jgi:hypothetical protein
MMKMPEQEHMPDSPGRFGCGIACRENSLVEVLDHNINVSRAYPIAFLNETT